MDGSIKRVNPEALQDDTTGYLGNRYGKLIVYFREVEKSSKNVGITRQQLWLEYKETQPDGYNYSQYCFHFGEYTRHKEVVMHLDHDPGAEAMVDFAGKKLSYVDLSTGEVISCQVFIGVLPCSGLMFCKAVPSQNTFDFNDCINAMLKYYGGSPKTILCANLKTAVSRPSRYEPVFTELCYQLGEHYKSCFSATRPYKPREKAMVERCVQIAYNHIYAPLRHNTYYSLKELNAAIIECLDKLNLKKYKGSSYSRKELYLEVLRIQYLQPSDQRHNLQ
ncbi:MAG: transposase [Saprospiraceae bacterium]|nr:transposase [Saprospiraceae bacterium]